MLAYGPVPSRRLGRSLGINNIPPKLCSYSCIYCQLGRTIQLKVKRSSFYEPKYLYEKVKNQISQAEIRGEQIDYLTFVPNGEPTLDINLGEEIDLMKSLGVKIAVIQNSSLIWLEDVRNDLLKADWVSLKVDAVNGELWHKINRPHGSLVLDKILDGMRTFADEFRGELTTETMMIRNYNDEIKEINRIADFLKEIKPKKAFLSIPTRPPAERWVNSAEEVKINEAYQVFSKNVENVEYLIGYEGDAFAFTGDVEKDILSITSVHPMREEGVKNLLSKAGADWSKVDKLIETGKLVELSYHDHRFYMRKISNRL